MTESEYIDADTRQARKNEIARHPQSPVIVAQRVTIPSQYQEKFRLWTELTRRLFCARCGREITKPFSHTECSGCTLVKKYEQLGGFRI